MLKIEKLNKNVPVYDINVEKNHNFYANDILVHNCQEINLPTSPIYDVNSEEGEISLCVLGAINLGTIKGLDELEEVCEYTVRMLDYIIDIQDYPVAAAKKMLKRRSLGIGVTNLAYWLAKNNLDYTSRSLSEIDRLFEHIQFNLLKASNKLAKEYGKCEYFDRTKYSKGLLPIDHYSKSVDTLVSRELECDWEGLRSDILEFGLRNSVVSAQMPCESCVTKETKILLENGDVKSYEDIFRDQDIDINEITNGEPRWINFNKPFNVKTKDGVDLVEKFWYNGEKEVYDVEFEDGKIYKMTANHRLLVNRDSEQVWVRCDELREGDDIVNINE